MACYRRSRAGPLTCRTRPAHSLVDTLTWSHVASYDHPPAHWLARFPQRRALQHNQNYCIMTLRLTFHMISTSLLDPCGSIVVTPMLEVHHTLQVSHAVCTPHCTGVVPRVHIYVSVCVHVRMCACVCACVCVCVWECCSLPGC